VNFTDQLYIAFLYLVRYKVVGFKAEGKGQRAEVECTPLILEPLYKLPWQGLGVANS
jgi:hypothetical protein